MAQDVKIDLQTVKIEQLNTEIDQLNTEIKQLNTEIVMLKTDSVVKDDRITKLQNESNIARELAKNEVREIANKILMLAVKGWSREDDGRSNFEAFKELFKTLRNESFLNTSKYANSFVQEATELNKERNQHVHPTPWTALLEQVKKKT
jgi:septal ring factor EnvC (AmiA/AmiB activator)